ncbi:hypothetical protein Pth03_21220 [Planotetraspora thailandica]|uniref:DUF4331 domain-containing protein n=1 Tax=Planotetraspora thailandica TaxID=487172 RepID=A0A8J3XY15_9ACTN|nr:DUF4331 family protein [Planotetraspora thailandica]GII53733.1 hypothetical protein Pth03_21220 [Planotetraspora thailandica]
MSHHLDSPNARKDVRLDISDLYVFRGEQATVFVMNVNHSIATEVTGHQVPAGCHPEARYEFKIDTNGDAVEDLGYRFTFGEMGADGSQTLRLHRLTGAEATDHDAEGAVIAHGVTGETVTTEDGLRLWAGKAGDPFWIEPDVLHAIGHALTDGTRADLSSWTPAEAKNLFAGQTVYSIVLEVPDDQLLSAAGADRRIGVWAVANLATDAGGWRQINRAGHPMIHPLLTQYDEELGNRLNATRPADDTVNYGAIVTDRVAAVVAAYGTAQDPQAYGEAVAAKLLPDVLPYTVGTSATYGYNELNGRSLTDNAPDVMFSLATNTAFTIGLTRDSVTAKPITRFPYVPPAA